MKEVSTFLVVGKDKKISDTITAKFIEDCDPDKIYNYMKRENLEHAKCQGYDVYLLMYEVEKDFVDFLLEHSMAPGLIYCETVDLPHITATDLDYILPEDAHVKITSIEDCKVNLSKDIIVDKKPHQIYSLTSIEDVYFCEGKLED